MIDGNNFVLALTEFNGVKNFYRNFFEGLKKEIFESISDKYEKLYNKVLKWIKEGKKFVGGAGVGRTALQYWRNMLYGWYFEMLLFKFLKLNNNIKSAELFGTDKEHEVFLEEQKIKISGIRTTKPDFKIITKKEKELAIEVLTAAKGIYTIKEPKVQMAPKTYGQYGIHTLFIMFDIVKGKYSIISSHYFKGKIAYPNVRMEGKLCFDLPYPNKKIKDILTENFDSIISEKEIKELENSWIIYKKYNGAETKEEKRKYLNMIKKERFEKQKKAFLEDINKKIKKLK